MTPIEWCIEQHKKTNHWYDNYLPYEFHLRMVVQVFQDFKHLLPGKLYVTSHEVYRGIWEEEDITNEIIELACWGHDLIEDCRVSYNDCTQNLKVGKYNDDHPADIIYAVTNEKGKNRKERANDKYYEGIRNTSGAVFVKLCDRIANVQYSKLTKSRMFEMYKKENEEFVRELSDDNAFDTGKSTHPLREMFEYLTDLFNS